MIHQQKVRRMARMSVYETRHGYEDEKVTRSFKNDYVLGQVLVTFVCNTIAFLLIAAVVVFYDLENVLLAIFNNNLISVMTVLILAYLLTQTAMIILTVLVYSSRYDRAKKRQGRLYHELKVMEQGYQREDGEILS